MRLVIISPPRTGSSKLASMLNAVPGQRILHEPFHTVLAQRQQSAKDYRAYLGRLPKCAWLDATYKALDYPVVGIKTVFGQHAFIDSVQFAAMHAVILFGRRPLNQIVASMLLAYISGAWQRADTQADRQLQVALTDPVVLARIRRTVYDVRLHEKWLRESGTEVIEFGVDNTPVAALAARGLKLGAPTTQRARSQAPESCITNTPALQRVIDQCSEEFCW